MERGLTLEEALQRMEFTIHDAVEQGDLDKLKLMLETGANPNQTNIYGESLLSQALRLDHSNRLSMVKLLLDHKADMYSGRLDVPSTCLSTAPIRIIVTRGLVDELRLFLARGFDLDRCKPRTPDDFSPLHEAASKEGPATLLVLLDSDKKHSLDLEHVDHHGRTPLALAVSLIAKNISSMNVRLLLETGANLNNCYREKESALYVACESPGWIWIPPELDDCISVLIGAGFELGNTLARLVPYNNIDGVETTSEDDDYDSYENIEEAMGRFDQTYHFMVARYIVKHRVLFESQRTVENPIENGDMGGSVKLRKYLADCKAEVARLRDTLLCDSVSYLDLLINENLRVKPRDESELQKFERENLKERFPVYAKYLRRNFDQMKERSRLHEIAMDKLSRLLGLDRDAFRLILERILNFLRDRHLRDLSET